MFKFYSNQLSNSVKPLAFFVLSIGLALVVLGILVIAVPAFFILVAAGLFFVAGASVIGYALKLFIAAWKLKTPKSPKDPQDQRRKNVRIHHEEDHQ